jgi:hypothetical protein
MWWKKRSPLNGKAVLIAHHVGDVDSDVPNG